MAAILTLYELMDNIFMYCIFLMKIKNLLFIKLIHRKLQANRPESFRGF